MIDMKTNRRKYRTFSRHGDFLFTKREANKRNRKDAKKMLTNIAQYIIISISNEREVNKMEELVKEYERKHAGHVTKINSYSFEFETVPNKDGKVERYTVMCCNAKLFS